MYEGIRSWVSLGPVSRTGGLCNVTRVLGPGLVSSLYLGLGVSVMYEGIRSWISLGPVSRTGGLCNVRGY